MALESTRQLDQAAKHEDMAAKFRDEARGWYAFALRYVTRSGYACDTAVLSARKAGDYYAAALLLDSMVQRCMERAVEWRRHEREQRSKRARRRARVTR